MSFLGKIVKIVKMRVFLNFLFRGYSALILDFQRNLFGIVENILQKHQCKAQIWKKKTFFLCIFYQMNVSSELLTKIVNLY